MNIFDIVFDKIEAEKITTNRKTLFGAILPKDSIAFSILIVEYTDDKMNTRTAYITRDEFHKARAFYSLFDMTDGKVILCKNQIIPENDSYKRISKIHKVDSMNEFVNGTLNDFLAKGIHLYLDE